MRRVAAVAGTDVSHVEDLNMVRYRTGEFFRDHHDGAFRTKTVFVYLNSLESKSGSVEKEKQEGEGHAQKDQEGESQAAPAAGEEQEEQQEGHAQKEEEVAQKSISCGERREQGGALEDLDEQHARRTVEGKRDEASNGNTKYCGREQSSEDESANSNAKNDNREEIADANKIPPAAPAAGEEQEDSDHADDDDAKQGEQAEEKSKDASGPKDVSGRAEDASGSGPGGRTVFPALGLRISPLQGCALVWSNIDDEGKADLDMVHNAEPVLLEGAVKYGINCFVNVESLE